LPPFDVKSFSIDEAEPLSSDVSITTVAPSFRHVCACDCCVVALPSALVINADTLAFLNAAVSSGLSNCCQRTDDCVSGSRTQT
jgi:hypothetical protein